MVKQSKYFIAELKTFKKDRFQISLDEVLPCRKYTYLLEALGGPGSSVTGEVATLCCPKEAENTTCATFNMDIEESKSSFLVEKQDVPSSALSVAFFSPLLLLNLATVRNYSNNKARFS